MAAGVSFDETRITDFEYGLICGAEATRTEPAPDTTTGTIQILEGWQKIILRTQVVPMVTGIGFGVSLKPASPRNLNDVRITITHPPYIGFGDTRESWFTDFSADGNNLNFFEFEHDFEMVKGQWTLEAHQGDTMLYSATFEVVDPSQVPHLANLCNGEVVTS